MTNFTTKTFEANIEDLVVNDDNPRTISKKEFDMLKKSLKEFPEMRSIREVVVDENMNILGGHQRVKALQELGETTVQVKQVIGLTEEQKKEFIIKDNRNSGDWDFDALMSGWDTELLMDWGVGQEKDFKSPLEKGQELLSVDIPVYQPKDKKPPVSALAKTDATDALLEEIDELDCPEELKNLFRTRAAYFTDFNFQRLADYYENESNEEVKNLFKRLGFVIVTPPEAIELGIAKLSKKIMDAYEKN